MNLYVKYNEEESPVKMNTEIRVLLGSGAHRDIMGSQWRALHSSGVEIIGYAAPPAPPGGVGGAADVREWALVEAGALGVVISGFWLSFCALCWGVFALFC